MAVRLSRTERREQTRQELVAAAEACFVSRGFHASSVEEVAERAGYTKGAVYSNFAAKEDLFFAVYERRVEQVLTEVVPGLRQLGAERAFDELAAGALHRRDPDDGWRAVFFEFWAHVVRRPELRERFAKIHARVLEPIASGVERWVEERGIELPVDARRYTVAVYVMSLGLSLERLTQPDVVDGTLGSRMARLLFEDLWRRDGKKEER